MSEDERGRILGMLRDGKITVEEATQLLDALGGVPVTEKVAVKDTRGRKPKKLRIVVDAAGGNTKNAKVNLSIPISLIRTVGPVVARNMPKEAKEELARQGVDITQILEDVERMLDEGIEEDFINIDAGGYGDSVENAKVRIFVE